MSMDMSFKVKDLRIRLVLSLCKDVTVVGSES